MKFFSISSRTDAFELDVSCLPKLKGYECTRCKRDYLPVGYDIPVARVSKSSVLSTFWEFRIGIASSRLAEILQPFGWDDAFEMGYLSYAGERLDGFRTFAGRKERISVWGGPGSQYMGGCDQCRTKDYSFPVGKKLFCLESSLDGLIIGESTTGIILREDAKGALPAEMIRKLNVSEVFSADREEIDRLRRKTVVWDAGRKEFFPCDAKRDS